MRRGWRRGRLGRARPVHRPPEQPTAGHFPHMEKPEIVYEALWQWLDGKMRFERKRLYAVPRGVERKEETRMQFGLISEGQILRRLLRSSSPNAQVFGPGLIPRSKLRGDLHST